MNKVMDVRNYNISMDFFNSYSQLETYITLAFLKDGKDIVDYLLKECKGSVWFESVGGYFLFLPTVANKIVELKLKEAK